MKAAFLSKPWKTRRKKAAQNSLKILEAHSTHVALRCVCASYTSYVIQNLLLYSAMLPIDEEDDDPDNDEDPHGLDHASEDGYADSIHQPLTPTSSEEDPAELLTQSLTPASYFAHSPINTLPICSMKSSRWSPMRIPITLRAQNPNLFMQHVVERSSHPVGESVHRVVLTVMR